MGQHQLVEWDPATDAVYTRTVEATGVQDRAVAIFDADPSLVTIVFTDAAGRDRHVTRRTVLLDETAARLLVESQEA